MAARWISGQDIHVDGGFTSSLVSQNFRRGINAADLTQFLIATALSLLLGIIPDGENTDVARHYIEVFVLPAIISDPPQPRAVFPRA